MLGLFKKKEEAKLPGAFNVDDNAIVALADGEQIDVSTVPDPMFAEKMMGDSIAFKYNADKVIICAPANGTLSVLFPTGHAFGITMKNGTELLVHIGVNTVNSKGTGFKLLGKKQGDAIRAGEPVVEVDVKTLAKTYDMSTMLIVTDPADNKITFRAPGLVKRGDSVIE